jgi:aminopeptidase N
MSFAQKEVRTITVSYSVENPVAGLLVSCPDESNPNVARYVVTDSETERARYWLACIDAPAVRVALDWTIRVPVETWEVMTNGKEVNKSKDESLGLYVSTWTMPFRTPPYLICFALGEFVRFEDDSFDGCPVAYFAPKDKSGVYDDIIIANHLKTTFGRTGRMLQWLEDRLGVPFPFKSLKYYQVVGYTLPSAMEFVILMCIAANLVIIINSKCCMQKHHAHDMVWSILL